MISKPGAPFFDWSFAAADEQFPFRASSEGDMPARFMAIWPVSDLRCLSIGQRGHFHKVIQMRMPGNKIP